MAVNPREVPITREVVHSWLKEWVELRNRPPVKRWIAKKVNETGYAGMRVNTAEHQDLGDETPLLEMLFADLPSYGFEDLD